MLHPNPNPNACCPRGHELESHEQSHRFIRQIIHGSIHDSKPEQSGFAHYGFGFFRAGATLRRKIVLLDLAHAAIRVVPHDALDLQA